MPEANDEVKEAEAKLKALNAQIADAEKTLDRLKQSHEAIKIDTEAAAELRTKVNSYRERTIKFYDLDAIEAKLKDFETRLDKQEAKKGGAK